MKLKQGNKKLNKKTGDMKQKKRNAYRIFGNMTQ